MERAGVEHAEAPRARSRWRGIRIRMLGVLLIPVLAAATLGVLQVGEAVDEAGRAAHAETISSALPHTFALALQLSTEREALSAGVPAETAAKVESATDGLIASWQAERRDIDARDDTALRSGIHAVSATLAGIDGLRKRIAATTTREQARADYTLALNQLFGLSQRLPALGDASIYDQTRALIDVRSSAEAIGTMRVLVGKALAARAVSDADRIALARAEATYARNTAYFARFTSRRALAEYDATNGATTARGGLGAPMMQLVTTIVDTGALPAGLTPEGWAATTNDFVVRVGPAVISSAVDLDTDVRRLRDARQEQATATAVVVGLLLLTTLLLGSAAARSITAPLRRLRDSALQLATSELPEQVRRLEHAGGRTTLPQRSAPAREGGPGEIAEVAAALDVVHAEALRLAAEQARLRAHVNTVVLNLARRSRRLVERQLRIIDDLEAGESDPARLAHVFTLDRLVTRLRRNDESLLVLAGARTAHATTEDSAVVDVMRAATSEVEQYDRVIVDTPETALVRGDLCVDLVHVLAELIENATAFSPPPTPVTVHSVAREPGTPLVIQVTDVGPGMTPEQLAEANARLRRPSELNADSARNMGLVVASRLAARHGWTVELRANWPHGVAATVTVPASALVRAATAPPVPSAPAAPLAPVVPIVPVAPVVPLTPTMPVIPLQPTSPPAAAGPAPDGPAPAPAEDDDASPIFASLESGWSSPLTAPVWTPRDDAEWGALLDDRTGRHPT